MIILRDRDRAAWPYACHMLSFALGNEGKRWDRWGKAGKPKNKKHLLWAHILHSSFPLSLTIFHAHFLASVSVWAQALA